jgi:hypothetical protein
MKWYAAFLLPACSLAGCHAPTPSFNVLAPYGPSRVAPPSTNAQRAGGAYYNQPAPAVGAAPGANNASPRTVSQPTLKRSETTSPYMSAEGAWKPVGTGTAPAFQGTAATSSQNALQQVSYTGPESTVAAEQSAGDSSLEESSQQTSGSTLRLGGMPINDATPLVEPAKFRAPAGAAPIPQPSTPGSTNGGIVVASAKSSDSAAPVEAAPKTTLQWTSRAEAPRLPGSTP